MMIRTKTGPSLPRGNACCFFFGKTDLALADDEKAVAQSPNNSQYVYDREATKKRVQTKTK